MRAAGVNASALNFRETARRKARALFFLIMIFFWLQPYCYKYVVAFDSARLTGDRIMRWGDGQWTVKNHPMYDALDLL